ncbi:MAG: DUF4349 domain-containing protein [Eubacteriales bacterium]|nr:DUF4349 domain-containing protein [Eubacteriales bacterium]
MKRTASLILIIALAISLASCGAGDGGGSQYGYYKSDEPYYGEPSLNDESSSYSHASNVSENSPGSNENNGEVYDQKIIYTAVLNLETLKFDQSVKTINESIAKYKGYIQQSYERGGDSFDGMHSYTNKILTLKIRIPSEYYDAFLSERESFGNVTSITYESQDVTGHYIDIISRLETLKEQEQQLMKLMKETGSLSEMIELQEALSNVRYEIENYTSQKKYYDNQIAYCTITIYLSEVNTITVSDNFWQKAGRAVRNSWASFVTFLQNLTIWLIYAVPYLAVIALLIYVISALRKRYNQKHPEKAAERKAAREAAKKGRYYKPGSIQINNPDTAEQADKEL